MLNIPLRSPTEARHRSRRHSGSFLLSACILLSGTLALSRTVQQLFERAAVSHQRGDFAAAKRDYRAVVAADPLHYAAHHNLGALYAAQQRWPEAEASYRRALEVDPAAWRTLLSASRPLEAMAQAQRLVSGADGESARLLLGRAYIAAGRTSEGCRELQRALNFNPSNSGVQLELAACYVEDSDLDAAALHAGAVIRRGPDNALARTLVNSIRSTRRADAWSWVPAVGFLVALFAAIGARRPEQWGQRRGAFGVMAISFAAYVWLHAGSLFWLTGGFWGLY